MSTASAENKSYFHLKGDSLLKNKGVGYLSTPNKNKVVGEYFLLKAAVQRPLFL